MSPFSSSSPCFLLFLTLFLVSKICSGSTLKELIFYEHDRTNTTTQLNPTIDWERQASLTPILSEFTERQRLAVFKIPETPLRKAVLKSETELQQPASNLLKLSKKYGAEVEEAGPQGSLTGALQKLKQTKA